MSTISSIAFTRRTRGCLAVALMVLGGFLLASCATTAGVSNDGPGSVRSVKKDVQVVGVVKVRSTYHGILGATPEISLISWGEKSSYVALLEEARKLGADDVVNLKIDLISSRFLLFYSESTWIASGLAIRYLPGVPAQGDAGSGS